MALTVQAADAPDVVASIRPLQWLAQALLPPGTHVQVLLPAGQSVHDYTLRPADVQVVQRGAFLLWAGPDMEPWLTQIAARLPAGQSLAAMPPATEHDHDNEDQHPDAHVWLDPVEMISVADHVAQALQQRFPDDADAIRVRLSMFRQQLQAVDAELRQQFGPVHTRGFVVYHDSYGRLVSRYHLNQKAAVWKHESIPAGVRERAILLALLKQGDVRCVFHEPEYGHEAIASWLSPAATGVPVMELDPLGDKIAGTGVDAYVAFLKTIAHNMVQCLQSGDAPHEQVR